LVCSIVLGPFYVQKRPEADFGFGANFGTPFGSGSQLIFFCSKLV
jgi:hypothetical protein